jgi:3-phosphoshikimate 1-carboxyvinyltransferase
MKFIVKPSKLSGIASVPPSKSHTMRAVLFASLAAGQSVIHNYLESPDTTAMINACRLLGAKITLEPDKLIIIGTAGKLQVPDEIIDAGNSGQVLRFIGALAALIPGYTVITGDASIRHKRPVQPLLNAIEQLGGFAVSTKNDGHAPIIIKGPIEGGYAELSGEDSQPVSGMLIAAAFLPGETEIKVHNPGETPWIDLTLYWFKRLGIQYQRNDYSYYKVNGKTQLAAFDYTVPSDFSSAAFPIVAALITGSKINLTNIDMQDVQGDKAIIPALQSLGALINYNEEQKILTVEKSPQLIGGNININDYVDAITILSVLGCNVSTPLQITGAAIAKQKESNRIAAITQELNKMQGQAQEQTDGLLVMPKKLIGTTVESYHDHRMAMSLAVAGLTEEGTTVINDVDCVAKSFASFVAVMQQLGADIQVVE